MGRPKLTQAQIDALPEKTRAETLRKRNARARAAGLPLPHPPAPSPVAWLPVVRPHDPAQEDPPPGIEGSDVRALEMYSRLKQQLIAENRWAGEATHGTLMTYCKTSVFIEAATDPADVKAHIYTAQSRAATILRLHEMQPVKIRKADKFGGDW